MVADDWEFHKADTAAKNMCLTLDFLASYLLWSGGGRFIFILNIMRNLILSDESLSLRDLVAEVVAAYFSNSHVNANDIPYVISQIASGLIAVGGLAGESGPASSEGTAPAKATAAQIRKSVTPDALISFEDGKSYKTLKRHLTLRGLAPADYRERWGLPHDYPMTAPSYSARRSELARSLGLGRKSQAKPAAKSTGGRKKV